MKELQGLVSIDELALDKECVRLPSDYLKCAHHAADCRRDAAEAINRVKVTEADLSKQIRENPGKFGLEKITESAINNLVLGAPIYQKAQAEQREAAYNSDLADVAVRSMDHKKSALKMLVDLHVMGYSANIKVSGNGRQAMEEQSKRETRRPISRD